MIGNIVIVVVSVIGMEVFALLFHKFYMHGPGWGWHESHHKHTEGYFETNDLYAVWFSVIAAALFVLGSLYWMPLWYIALGFTIYGILYGFVHDGLVHQRWPFRITVKRGYLYRLILAHRMHHHVTTKHGAVSFGFLWAEKPDVLKAQLKAKKAA
ncbi:sterol desaturase family protein [Robiginitomaculum antarcticum]|uniref:sterol desaturase family protein n=1 Tax=Robiginitomaculum antarcticum TaxID=437507 RepID=UPI00036B4F35|nr:sterol desaturase family protein [Robiginitomaculum antarcticum]